MKVFQDLKTGSVVLGGTSSPPYNKDDLFASIERGKIKIVRTEHNNRVIAVDIAHTEVLDEDGNQVSTDINDVVDYLNEVFTADNRTENGDNSVTNVIYNPIIRSVNINVTIEQINSGNITILQGVSGRRIRPIQLIGAVNGTFTGLTRLVLESATVTANELFSITVGNLTSGNSLNLVKGNINLGDGVGIRLRRVGVTALGGSSIDLTLLYIVT